MSADSSHSMSPAPLDAGPHSAREVRARSALARQLCAVTIGLFLFAPWAVMLQGWGAAVAPALAAGVCLAGVVAGTLCVLPLRGMLDPFQRMSAAMLVRMAIPLAACLLVMTTISSGPLAGEAFALYTVLFYLVTLGVEVWTSTSVLAQRPAKTFFNSK